MIPRRRNLPEPPPANILTDLVWYYRHEDTSGNATDSSGNARTLTAVNAPTSTPGRKGLSRDFLASSTQHFTHADHASFNFPGSMHVCGWLRLTLKGAFRGIFVKGSSAGTDQYNLFYNTSTDRLTWIANRASDGAAITIGGTNFGSPPLDTWIFVELYNNFDGVNSSTNMRINRVAESPLTLLGGMFVSTGTVYFGNSRFTQPWNGQLDEWAGRKGSMWTDDHMDWVYNNGAGRTWDEWNL